MDRAISRRHPRALALAALACVAALGSCTALAADAPAETGTTPVPRHIEYPWMSVATWNRMHAEDMAVADQGGVDLLFVGDSITQLWDAQAWQESFGRYHAANFGIGGDHTGNLLWRLQDGHAGKLHPKLVVLLIGVNNFGHLHEGVPEVAAGVTACLAQLRQLYPDARVLLLGVLPHEQAATSPARAEVRALNARLAPLADGVHVFYRDYGPALLEADDSLSPATMADFLHPTPAGYRRWAAAMGPDIDALMHDEVLGFADPRLAVMGRSQPLADGAVRVGYPGVSFKGEFTGSRLVLAARATTGNTWIEAIVDGRGPQLLQLSTTLQEYPLVVPPGTHHRLEVMNRSEAWHGFVTLASLRTDGQFLAAPPLPSRRVLVLGDSVTCAEGVDRVPGRPRDTRTSDPRHSWGLLLADALEAQAQLVCMGGHGLVRTWDGHPDELNLADYYALAVPSRQDPAPWDPARWHPQLVLSAIGTNDFNLGLPDHEEYVATYVRLVRRLLADHPGAQVVLTEGAILDGGKKQALAAWLGEVVKRVADAHVRYLPSRHYPGDTEDAHPTRAQHARMAADFTAPLRRLMGW